MKWIQQTKEKSRLPILKRQQQQVTVRRSQVTGVPHPHCCCCCCCCYPRTVRSIFSSHNLKYFSSIFDRQLKLRCPARAHSDVGEGRGRADMTGHTHCNAKGNVALATVPSLSLSLSVCPSSAAASCCFAHFPVWGISLCFPARKCERRMWSRTTNETLLNPCLHTYICFCRYVCLRVCERRESIRECVSTN